MKLVVEDYLHSAMSLVCLCRLINASFANLKGIGCLFFLSPFIVLLFSFLSADFKVRNALPLLRLMRLTNNTIANEMLDTV